MVKKRMKKRIGLTVAVCLLIVSLLSGCVSAESDTALPLADYLNKNYANFDGADFTVSKDLRLMDADLSGKKLILAGEFHGMLASYQLRMKLLTYVKQKTDFAYYLCEIGHSQADLLNRYLESGDTALLDTMYEDLRDTSAWNKSDYKHWTDLYAYNAALPKKKKIRIIGIDVEHQTQTALAYLQKTLPQAEAPAEISDSLALLRLSPDQMRVQTDEQITDFSQALSRNIDANEALYRHYLGNDAFMFFRMVNRNIAKKMEFRQTGDNNVRERAIFANFQEFNEWLPEGVFFGQWGQYHVYLTSDNSRVNHLATMIRLYLADEYKDKILNIAYAPVHSQTMSALDGSAQPTDGFDPGKNAEVWNPLIQDQPFTIFKLNGKRSPFSTELIWPVSVSYTGFDPKAGVTTDYIQYLIVIRNSPATEPLGQPTGH